MAFRRRDKLDFNHLGEAFQLSAQTVEHSVVAGMKRGTQRHTA